MPGFEEQPNGYSPTNAVFFAKASLLAYKSAGDIQATAKDWGLDGDFTFFDAGGTTPGYLATDAGKAVLSFRGTQVEEMRDVVADARVRKEPEVFGKVHRGFKDALDEVWGDVAAAAGAVGDRRLWITGHSLGAALAVLAAARLSHGGHSVAGVYPLGQPRVGNASFVRAFDRELPDRCFRVVNYIDIVPRLPPLSFGYRHQKTRV
jgi:triacylglycerol lipase